MSVWQTNQWKAKAERRHALLSYLAESGEPKSVQQCMNAINQTEDTVRGDLMAMVNLGLIHLVQGTPLRFSFAEIPANGPKKKSESDSTLDASKEVKAE